MRADVRQRAVLIMVAHATLVADLTGRIKLTHEILFYSTKPD
jgi:hypothetical protein